jgi:aryl-alcohol dehydrogenase-like predicted oxidoreductase
MNNEEHGMEYRPPGRTGVSMSPLCLGTMMSGPWGNDDRADRGIEEDVLPAVQRHGMGALVYSPLSGGRLTGRWREGAPGTLMSAARPGARFDMSTPANQRTLDVVEELAQLAEKVRHDDDRARAGLGDQPSRFSIASTSSWPQTSR